jgi:putative DNA-invertase from lambdoid prophage Rac
MGLLRNTMKNEDQNRGIQMGQPIAMYCRVSTSDQSCDRQEGDLRAFTERGGYEVVGVFKETASGSKNQLAQRGKAVLVTELTRWGSSTTDLLHSLQELEACGVSVIAQTGLQFDLTSSQGKLFASLMAALAEFERDLLREWAKSGIAAARERGVQFGRHSGQQAKAERYTARVLRLRAQGRSYREIARELHLSKNTVVDIANRAFTISVGESEAGLAY